LTFHADFAVKWPTRTQRAALTAPVVPRFIITYYGSAALHGTCGLFMLRCHHDRYDYQSGLALIRQAVGETLEAPKIYNAHKVNTEFVNSLPDGQVIPNEYQPIVHSRAPLYLPEFLGSRVGKIAGHAHRLNDTLRLPHSECGYIPRDTLYLGS